MNWISAAPQCFAVCYWKVITEKAARIRGRHWTRQVLRTSWEAHWSAPAQTEVFHGSQRANPKLFGCECVQLVLHGHESVAAALESTACLIIKTCFWTDVAAGVEKLSNICLDAIASSHTQTRTPKKYAFLEFSLMLNLMHCHSASYEPKEVCGHSFSHRS